MTEEGDAMPALGSSTRVVTVATGGFTDQPVVSRGADLPSRTARLAALHAI